MHFRVGNEAERVTPHDEMIDVLRDPQQSEAICPSQEARRGVTGRDASVADDRSTASPEHPVDAHAAALVS